MKTVVDIRIFAVEQAVKILGAGTPDKAVVAKAKEIEAYVTNGQEIPVNGTDTLSDIASTVGLLLASYLNSEKKEEAVSVKSAKAGKGDA